MASPAELTAEMPPQVHSAADAYRLGEPLADQHGHITSADNTRLFYRHWPAMGLSARRAVIVLHGIGYHSGPYKVIADALNPQGIDVYGLDARGHGLSCGPRGFVGTPAEAQEDVAALARFVRKQQPLAKIFLLGDSMGCNYALNHARDHDNQLAGLILLAPAFYLNFRQLLRLESLLLLPYFLFAHRRPVIDLLGHRLDESSLDHEWIAERRADALAYKKVSFGYLLDIQRLIVGWRRSIAPRVHAPILMIKGEEDHIVSQRDCEIFHRISVSRDKQFDFLPAVRHTTLWDPQAPKILQRIASWIAKR